MAKSVRTVLSLLLTLVMIVALVACGSGSNQTAQTNQTSAAVNTQAPTTAETEKVKEPITIRMLILETGTKWNSLAETDVYKEIQKQTGVTLELVEADENKYNMLLAGGDLPDIIRTNVATYAKQLIEGNLVIPLDDLLQTNGQDILKNIPDTLAFSKKFWSNNTNKTYFIPPEVQPIPSSAAPFELGIGLTIRWDYYKELGYPTINNTDDLLKVLADMVKLHPKTDDGKKVFGVSGWNDWGLWPEVVPLVWQTGINALSANYIVGINIADNYIKCILDEDGSYWKHVSFYYKAKNMGLLDPDMFIMKFADYTAKATAGQILSSAANFTVGDFNNNNAKDGKGFMVLPVPGYEWGGGTSVLGWSDKCQAITKSAKDPARVMDFMNFLWSYDGVRLMTSGIKGKHWDVIDGKAQAMPELIKMKKENPDALVNQVGLDPNMGNQFGLSGNNIHPVDNQPLSLLDSPDFFAERLNPLQKDFSDYYKVPFPGKIFYDMAKEGKMKNYDTYNGAAVAVIAPCPDDLKKIEAKINDIAVKYVPKCVLSKSDSEYEANKTKAMEEFKAAGLDQLVEWYKKAYEDAKAAVAK